MRSYERYVTSDSDYYTYTPSATAQNMFFYPLLTGYFYYQKNYHLKRSNYNNFLIMLITKGSCMVTLNGVNTNLSKGQLAFIDCESLHEYRALEDYEALWLHFNGPLAREYYKHISSNSGNILFPRNLQVFEHTLSKIYNIYKNSEPIKEASMSKYITQILTELLLSENHMNASHPSRSLEESVTYINEHFTEPISLNFLAEKVALSPFYFSRIFTKEIGMPPHQYIIATRLNFAKFLLQTTDSPIKEIAFNSGFTSESNFCFTFKKWEKVTPSQYRSTDSIV